MKHKQIQDVRARSWWWMENRAVDEQWIAHLGVFAWAVYCVLVRHSDDRGKTLPSAQQVSDITGISLSQVRRSYKVLLGSGLIRRAKRGTPTSPTVYQINEIPTSKNAIVRQRSKPRQEAAKETPRPRPGNVETTANFLAELDRVEREAAVEVVEEQAVWLAPDVPVKPKLRSGKRVPSEWQPNDKHLEIAAGRNVNFGEELDKFRDHQFAVAKSDWDATFRNWLRNARPSAPNRTNDARREVERFYETEQVV